MKVTFYVSIDVEAPSEREAYIQLLNQLKGLQAQAETYTVAGDPLKQLNPTSLLDGVPKGTYV